MNRLQYKGYTGEYQIDLENGEIVGKLENIRDLVTFCTREISSLEAVFREAVDDYLADCEEIGRQPDKPCSTPSSVGRESVISIGAFHIDKRGLSPVFSSCTSTRAARSPQLT